MATTSKIPLYLASSLEELNTRTSDNPTLEKAKLSNCAQISHVIESTWAEAKKSELGLDEERAYVLYMRLFSCLTAMKNAKDVSTNQGKLQQYQRAAIIWLEKADQLSESLKARYDEIVAVQLEKEKEKQAVIDEDKALSKSIKPKLLYKYLRDSQKNVLLIDMRSKTDHDQSHMRTTACIHVPADLMQGKGWTSWNVESTLTDQQACAKFKQRASFDYIVLFDEGTYEADLKAGNCLLALKQAIHSYDRDVQLKREPLILDGGYEDWMATYPGESTAPLPLKNTHDQLSVFEVSYPDDVYIPQEVPSDAATAAQPEAAMTSLPSQPQIDRTRKPIAAETTMVSPTLEQQEWPMKTTVEEPPTTPLVVTPQLPEMPDRSIKPTISTGPLSPASQEVNGSPTVPETPARTLPAAPMIPRAHLGSEIPSRPPAPNPSAFKNDVLRENIPPRDAAQFSLPNRDSLFIYRPFNRTVAIQDTNQQYQAKFDAVTGRKIILDTKTNQYLSTMPENETNRPFTQPIPTVNRDVKPILTEQMRRQLASDYRAVSDHLQVNGRTGLKNLGNSCYMNAIIQALSFNTLLTNYFLSGDFNRDINTKNKFGSGGAVAREWFKLMYVLWSQQFSYIVPQPFKYVVGNIQRAYLGTQQQDAHEFLVFLLDSLHEDLNQTHRPRIEELKAENYTNDRLLAEATKQAFRSHNKSVIIDLFYGLFKSTTICRSCSYNSYRFEAFAVNSVPIPSLRQCSLDDCLELFRVEEHLKGEERYECSKCKRLSEKNRSLDIWELPKIFIVHFKRFRLQQTHYIKNETLIRYPISNVDFSRWSQIPSRSRYSLISVVNHFGSMNSGHYTSYCNDGQQWYYCDDQSMRPADQRELERNVHAYLLVYSSISQPPLTLPPISN